MNNRRRKGILLYLESPEMKLLMRKAIFLLFFFFSLSIQAQEPEKLNSSEIFKEIQKLNFLGAVLYVAAHPDDENTRLISYLSNEMNARTAYLSLTRGDGGQNLIGPELRELLGLIRTQELLEARKIDGGEQFFTRANDFGYSKNPEETLEIWNEEEVLKDVVGAIRKFQPDIVINRFNANSAGETHGHHTSSALLSKKAFELAARKEVFPKQAERLGTWKPKKLFFNTSPWFYDSQEAFEAADKSDFLEFDTGVYYPLEGLSNTEIASLSRSQHKSQGFGSTGSRGKEPEYIQLIAGEHPENNNNLFQGINTGWSRVQGGKEVGKILNKVEENYNFQNPAASVPELVKAFSLIQSLENEHWRNIKSVQIKKIIAASAGLYLEAVASEPLATAGEEINISLEAINRSPGKFLLKQINLNPGQKILSPATVLQNNESWRETAGFKIPANVEYSSPYWLKEQGSLGMYKVDDMDLRGLPETPRQLKATFVLDFSGTEIEFDKEIIYKYNDPVEGEVYQPFEIVPQVSVSTATDVMIFPDNEPLNVPVTIKAMKKLEKGTLRAKNPGNWKVIPESFNLGSLQKGEEKTFIFKLSPPDFPEKSEFQPVAEIDGKEYSKEIVQLDYKHIPLQTLVLPNKITTVKLDVKKAGDLIGYIEGAGDVVPQALEQIGYKVEKIDPEKLSSAGQLSKYDAIVTGIRAYNTVPALEHKQQILLDYVNAGGNLVIQYNTNRGIKTPQLAPYPLELSRDRVTNENAEVRFLAKEHPVLNFPNKIIPEDFEGWVQERGLYFPDAWAPEFTAVLSMNDPNESPKEGSLLVAPYGKGNYIYTGLSFFREFPAGVPGAFRLFANLLSLGKEENALEDPN